MSSAHTDTQDFSTKVYTTRAAHFVCYFLLALVLIGALFARCYYPFVIEQRAAVKQNKVSQVDQGINPNTASWQMLTCLPAIGEVKARRIVRYRREEATGPDQPNTPVFKKPADLEAVYGIGPKTVQKISPYLKFPPSEAPNESR
jgi:DNA uptake protein ComE-like DNA-binding protein